MAKHVIDWDSVEKHYRIGIKSLRLLADEYGVSNPAILKRAKRDGWVRDLGAKVRARAEEKVSKSAVSREVSVANQISENQIVEANAELTSQIILAHRADIQRARNLSMKLLTELEEQTDGKSLITELRAFLLASEEGSDQASAVLINKITSLSSRSSTMKTLADSLRGLVMLEREVFGIKGPEEEGASSGIEDVIKRVMAKNEGLG